MKDLLKYLVERWQAAGYPEIAAIFALLAGTSSAFWQLGIKFWKGVQQRKLQQDLHPFYSTHEIRQATEFYVETTCQNVAPSKEHEPGKSRLFAAKEKVLPFFLKNAFKTGQDEYQFYIILADSGMGKTTLLLNLYLRYTSQFLPQPYTIKIFPLGDSRTDQEIAKMSVDEQRRTILLLDAFDEDIQAVANHTTRLNALIQKTQEFREVVLTCRTQFFPREEEEPGETGILKFGGEKGFREFYKLYLSPFDDHDIQRYLRKRFPWYQWTQRRKARQIVDYSPNLMVRPMLLSYIGELLESQRQYTKAFMLYEELIAKWIDREVSRVPSKQRKQHTQELYTFSREVALNIYRQRQQRQGMLVIPGNEIAEFATAYQINLDAITMKSRSLLNRNTQGLYKFSHKSILEYFLAEEALSNPDFRKEFDFDGMSAAETFFNDMVWEKLTVPFFSRGDVEGQYTKNGKSLIITKLPEKILADITTLTLSKWDTSNDLLVFSGLPSLKRVEVTTHQSVTIIWAALRSQKMDVPDNKKEDVFGLDKNGRPLAYIANEYEDRGEVVFDHATGLMWQKSGSDSVMAYAEAQTYIKKLNQERFAGYDDWRLPTVPELMSLLEPTEKNGDLYIDPIFDTVQKWCWSADKCLVEGGSSSVAWLVDFDLGNVYWSYLDSTRYVRAVRS